MSETTARPSWSEIFRAFYDPSTLKLLFLGFSAGIPLALIFGTLSLWLLEAEVKKSTVTFFGLATLGYSFKFVWAPLVDRLPLPLLSRLLGQRRAWLLLAQFAIISVLIWMANINPLGGGAPLTIMALAAVALGFSSATQDIVIDAYRIETASTQHQATLAAMYMCGYRVAMIASGAGALFLASRFGTSLENYQYGAWQKTYLSMAALMLVGVLTTLLIKEPEVKRIDNDDWKISDYLRFLLLFLLLLIAFVFVYSNSASIIGLLMLFLPKVLDSGPLVSFLFGISRLSLALAGAALVGTLAVKAGLTNRAMVKQTYIQPVADFFDRYGLRVAFLLLALIGLYRISDIVLGMIANVFYYDEMGYTKNQIGAASKTFGVAMTILGGFVGGALAMRYGVIRLLFVGAVLSAATNLLFIWLSYQGTELLPLYIVLSLDNLSQGLSLSVFIAFLSSLTNVSFTAMQYAIFSSIMTLLPKVIGGYSGSIVTVIGYPAFFSFTALLGVPILWLVWKVSQYVKDGKLIQASES